MGTDYKKFPILYVDDERANRVSIEYALSEKFTLILASTGEEALRKLVEHDVAVLLADQRMPDMTGVDACERAKKLKPDVVRMIVTAYGDLTTTKDAINLGQVTRFISKPWTNEGLEEALRTGIEVFSLNRMMQEMEGRLLRDERVSAALVVAGKLDHEVRGSLQIVQANLEGLKRQVERLADPGVARDVTEIADESLHAIAVANAVLDRHKYGKVLRANEPLDAEVRKIAEITAHMLRDLLDRRARVAIFVDPEDLRAVIGATELTQIYMNLLTNACDALPLDQAFRNRIDIHVKAEADTVVLRVSDTGRGIPPEQSHLVFDELYTTKTGGSGLGLAIVRDILHRRGGEIALESEVGKGSTFVVRIPVFKAALLS